jgi:hypothetical protein
VAITQAQLVPRIKLAAAAAVVGGHRDLVLMGQERMAAFLAVEVEAGAVIPV